MGNSQRKSYHLIYFLLQPFFTLLYYLRNFRKPAAKNVMWLFSIFYAFTFAIGVESKTSDINSYMNDIPLLHNLKLGFSGLLAYYYASGEVDILRTALAYLISYFTSDGYYLIIVYGIIFGYFYSRNMWYVLIRLKGKLKPFTRILLFCLFLIIPIWFINGFRFWTATHIFMFGLLPFLFEGKRKSLIWCFITPFIVHYSFIIALFPLVIYLILGNRIKLYFVFFVFTLLLSEVNISQFNSLVETYAPVKFAERSSAYRVEDKVKERRNQETFGENSVWYIVFFNKGMKFTMVGFLILFYLNFRKNSGSKDLLGLLSFILLFYGFASILSSIPSGGRFIFVANLLTLSFLALYLQNNKVNRDLVILSKIAVPILLIFIIVAIRTSWYSFSLMTILGNPIAGLFTFGDNISLNDIIKGL